MEEFYNLIRMWYVPTKHAGLIKTKAKKMLNYDARQVGIWHEPSVLGYAYMHFWRRKGSIKGVAIGSARSLIHVIWNTTVCVTFQV